MVTGTTSPSTRYERISVSPASCSIKSEYVIASHAFKPQYKCINYTPAWEQRKFSDVAMIKRGLTYSPTDIVDGAGGIRVLRSSNINEDQFVLNNDDVFVNEGAVTIDLVHDGDILITAANGSPRLVGKRARISDLPGKTVQGGFMLVASSPCSDFLCASMGSSWYRRFLATGVAGGNGAIGNLDSKALGETTIAVPNDAEKDKIGCFFTRLDSLITLHQRKYDKLVVFKKSMLEKMFPKDGESVPEIRFAGFTDPWEQRKFSDIVDVYSGKDYKHLEGGPIPVYGTGGFMTSVDEALSYDRDAVGIGRKGTIDKPYLLKAPFWTVDTLFYAIPKPDMDLEFVHCSFLNVDWKSKDESTGLPSLSKEAINETIALVPSFNEQSRLGEFFSDLDSLITLHQRKLELLQNIKKSLLDKMFV